MGEIGKSSLSSAVYTHIYRESGGLTCGLWETGDSNNLKGMIQPRHTDVPGIYRLRPTIFLSLLLLLVCTHPHESPHSLRCIRAIKFFHNTLYFRSGSERSRYLTIHIEIHFCERVCMLWCIEMSFNFEFSDVEGPE